MVLDNHLKMDAIKTKNKVLQQSAIKTKGELFKIVHLNTRLIEFEKKTIGFRENGQSLHKLFNLAKHNI